MTDPMVRAKMPGFYHGHRSQGAAFALHDASDFSPGWMEATGWTPSPPSPHPVRDDLMRQMGDIRDMAEQTHDVLTAVDGCPEGLPLSGIAYWVVDLLRKQTERADALSAEADNATAAFDAIRAELAKADGMPVGLNLAEAVSWLVSEVKQLRVQIPKAPTKK